MPTITVTTPRPASPFDPNDLIIDTHDNEPWKRTLPQLLIKVGQKLIEHNLNSGWMSLSQVSAFCRRYRLHWQRTSTKAKDLRIPVEDLFSTAGYVRANGVRIESKTAPSERRRRPDLFLLFTRTYPDGTCTSPTINCYDDDNHGSKR
jgi:hypothetical protein